jgi:hypothetical protein
MRLEQLALFYPEVAALIAEGCRALPLVMSVDLVWNDSTGIATGDEATGSFANVLSEPFLIQGITYVVERPNAFNGNVLKGDSDVKTGEDPYVDASIMLISSKVVPRYTIQVGATALPNITSRFEDFWPQGWLLEPLQNPLVTGRLTRDLEVDENPYRVRLGFRGLQIDCLADVFRTCCAAPRDDLRARCLAGIKKITG